MSDQEPNARCAENDWDQSRLGWLSLACFEGFGSRSLARLSSYIQDGAEAAGLNPTELEKLGINPGAAAKYAAFRATFEVETVLAQMQASAMRFVMLEDADYPTLLKQISDPPFALFVRGNFDLPSVCVALVGTRRCTFYGRKVAGELARGLAQAGLGIVSGLALGIDAAAHEAALEGAGWCIAVLGTGCDDASIYPRANYNLGLRIIQNGGCLVSEFPPGTGSLKHHFPLRNRIIAGLSRAVVVVEADEISGSLITAHLALGYDRDVLSVPGPITSPVSTGSNKLLKLGATPCTSAADILEMLELPPCAEPKKVYLEDLGAEERKLLAQLESPAHMDELARQSGCPVSEVARLLAALEMGGYVTDQGGKIFSRSVGLRTRRGK